MKREKNDFIYIGLIVTFILYVIFGPLVYTKKEADIKRNGVFTYGIITDEFIGVLTVRQFSYSYFNNEKKYTFDLDVEMNYFNKHKIGDTIIIKYLPNKPKKNIIIENEEYRTCYGLPPKEGWKKLPICK